MTPEFRTLAAQIAKSAQRRAALLAPYQNYYGVRLAPRGLFRRVLWRLFPPRPMDLPEAFVTDIVNDLLNAGNLLEQAVRDDLRKEKEGVANTPPPRPAG